MSRSAEDILEFDRLRDLLRRRTTCEPGRSAVDALSFSHDRSALNEAFALIAEAVEYLRDGSELGFGSLPDPARRLAELESPVAVLTPSMLIDAAALVDTAAMLREMRFAVAGASDGSRGASGHPASAISVGLSAARRKCRGSSLSRRDNSGVPCCPMEKSATMLLPS